MLKKTDNKSFDTKSLIYISLFVALIYVGSLIKLEIFTVPFTLQTMMVMLAACVLGVKRSIIAILIYIAMGLIGLPVFARGGGFHYVIKPTFGYILGFIPAAAFISALNKKTKTNIFLLICVNFIGGIIMLAVGALYAYIILNFTTSGVSDTALFINLYFSTFIVPELLKALTASLVYKRLHKYIKLYNY